MSIKVHDEEFGKDNLAGWVCVGLDRTRAGWKVVRLFDGKRRRRRRGRFW